MIKIKDLLPIGSVVRLVDGEKYLMIIGIMQSEAGINGKNYDYLGVLYPEGHIGEGFQYLFNHEDVDKVIFRGFHNDERETFLSKLSAIYEGK